MSAELLRRAATKMRERATEAFRDGSRDLWATMPTIDPDNNGWIVCEQRQPEVDSDTTVALLPYDYEGRLAPHIASWHPIVAFAVSDWLEATARRMDLSHNHGWRGSRQATAVARAYLGDDA